VLAWLGSLPTRKIFEHSLCNSPSATSCSIGPQQPLVELAGDVLANAVVLDRQEAFGVVPIVLDEFLS
jgi:hypothetical protein